MKALASAIVTVAIFPTLAMGQAEFGPADLTADVTTSQCPDAIMNNGLKKTYLLCKDSKSYTQAKSDAESRSIDGYQGYLVNIDDQSENDVLADWLGRRVDPSEYADTSADDGGGAAYVWIGGDDISAEGSWTWQRAGANGYPKQFWQGGPDGSARNGLYNNWGTDGGVRNEPDNYLNNQDGAAIALQSWPRGAGFSLGSAGQWNDVNTSNRLYYIVEFDTVEGLDTGGGQGPTETLRVALEEPVSSEIHTGVGNIRGWAVASDGVTKVEIWIDGAYAFDAPYGGERGDVGSAFPEIDGSANSGFSAAYNYSNLSAGSHSIKAIAHTGSGATKVSTKQFNVVRFPSSYIADPDAVDLNTASCSMASDEISIVDALVEGNVYVLTLKWRTAEQGFEIIEIR